MSINVKEIVLHVDWKTKKLMVINPNGADLLVSPDEIGGEVHRITEEMLRQSKQKDLLNVEQFEQWLSENFSNEQCIALYDDWGRGLTVMVGRLATSLGIEKVVAKEIVHKAAKHRLLVSGWNSAWKVSEVILKERWKDKAKDMVKYLDDVPERISLQEQMDRMDSYKTVVEPTITVEKKQPVKRTMPVEVMHSEPVEEFPSKAKAAIEAQKKARDEQSKRDSDALLGKVDERKTARQIDTKTYKETGKVVPVKKHL